MGQPKSIPQNFVYWITITPRPKAARLTPVQARIVRLVALGCTDHQIAAVVCRSVRSVRRHEARAMKKARVTDRAALARWALDQGLSHPNDRLSPTERRAILES